MQIILILIILIGVPAWGQFNVNGYYESQSILNGGKDDNTQFYNQNILKINLEYKDTHWRFLSDLRLGLFYGADNFFNPTIGSYIYLMNQTVNKNQLVLGIAVPRMYIRLYSPAGDFVIGRSYLNFGQNYFFNPLEWYKSFSLLDPTATKAGVNMLSWEIGLGSYGKAKAFIGSDDKWDSPLAGLEFIFGATGFEAGTVYQYKGNNHNVLGAFFKADLGISLFGTYAAHLNDITTGKGAKFSHEFNIGADYSFPLGLTTLLVQQIFYFNSLGADTISELLTKSFGDYYFRGKSYSYTSLQLTIDQFSSVQTDVIVNIFDASGVVVPSFMVNILNNLVLNFAMTISWGKKESEFSPKNTSVPDVSSLLKLQASF